MTELSHNECGVQLALMLTRGDNLFDETRFQYISSLYERSDKQRHAVSSFLRSKVQKLMASYLTDLATAQEISKILSKRIRLGFPECKQQVEQLERYYNVSALTKLEERLTRTKERKGIRTLTNILLQDNMNEGSESAPSFAELLQNQENEVITRYTSADVCINATRKELKSSRLFRESQDKFHSEKLVRQAIKEGPDNPGPINPHMLAIRSLSTMQSLSPQYLKRYLSYIDTVFWLEQASEKLKT